MESNAIKGARNKFLILFFAIVIFEILFLVSTISIVSKVLADSAQTHRIIIGIICVGLGGVFLVGDIVFLYRKIYKLIILEKQEPHYGYIADYIIEYDYSSNAGTFLCYPLIREDLSGKLYFSYGKYSLSWYKTVYLSNRNHPISVSILRADNSVVEPGDRVVFYKIRELNKKVVVNGNALKIGRKKMVYRHVNEEYSIEDMKNVILYEGAVDVG